MTNTDPEAIAEAKKIELMRICRDLPPIRQLAVLGYAKRIAARKNNDI